MTKAVYDQVTKDEGSIIARLMKPQGRVFEQNPNARPFIYDTLALAYAVDPSLAADAPDMWIDVDTSYGQGYGRTFGYPQARAAPYMRKARVIRRFDNERFYRMFVDLLTRPVPVKLRRP
jgi:inosine-uridine nucleoside N-ribohydrolase